jgi:purine nucleosidase
MRIKVILDTDIGNDIDDALTLAYLLAHPGCELLGITTVTARPIDRARLASAICHAYGADVPIAPGAARPLHREPLQEPPFSTPGDWPHATDFPLTALDLLRDTIRAHPGEVTIVAVGPLTNLGALFQADPTLPALLRSVILMGGRFFTTEPRPEWNTRNDPEAATIVYGSPLPHLRAVGLDVTRQITLTAEAFRTRFSGILLDLAGPWLERRGQVTFHDPLAASTLFHPFCGYQTGAISVGNAGFTHFTPHPDGPHEVASSVSPGAFLTHYFATLAAHPHHPTNPAHRP